MNGKGQGALEYLLLIGGAVLVAAIVIALITGTASGQKDPRAMAKCALHADCQSCLADGENECKVVLDDTTETLFGDGSTEICDATTGDVPATIDDPSNPGTAIAVPGDFKYCTTTKTI
ncbi:MAG: class III signal peptide-containing protein [Candidatus Diapherotrites archaeon]|uniref:Class III signal peptide-containing protein n=1 Tax=Candidatus Iainarchaeum sp. TaxID=3101447 RepID=A0A938YPN5_9ARCH|nr:class III signal peptide-containing protein [Candidatus Diapherotrites archaeon]